MLRSKVRIIGIGTLELILSTGKSKPLVYRIKKPNGIVFLKISLALFLFRSLNKNNPFRFIVSTIHDGFSVALSLTRLFLNNGIICLEIPSVKCCLFFCTLKKFFIGFSKSKY